jgi:iron complex transport system substrate-binding protein
MKKLLCILLLVTMLTACGGPAAQQGETMRAVTDHAGFTVELPEKVERVVVCDILPLPSVLSVFFDSADKLVGISGTSRNAAENGLLGQLYPEILEAQTGFIDGSTVNTEELLKLQPDVVFYNASRTELGEQLRRAGFPAVAVSVNKWEYDCIETLNQWIDLLGEIFPENDRAQTVREYSERMETLVRERTADIPEKERVLFLYQYSDTNILTSGAKFFGQWWADAIGAENVAQELATDNSVAVNMEQIYAWNPSLIFMTNFTTAGPRDLYENTVGIYDWSGIDAVQNQRVYKMPLGLYRSYTPGADTPVTLLWMAKTAYPELFADIDILEETKTYYKEVFGIELTDAQAASIFEPEADAGSGF